MTEHATPLFPRVPAAPPVTPPSSSHVSSSLKWLLKKRVLLALLTLALVIGVCIFVYNAYASFRSKYVDWPRYELKPLVTPHAHALGAAHTAILETASVSVKSSLMAALKDTHGPSDNEIEARRLVAAAHGRSHGAPPLKVFRPFNEQKPSNYFGTVSITRSKSATLHVTSAGYFEVVIYSQPDWKPVFAEANIAETPLDFLAKLAPATDAATKGAYAVTIFSTSDDTRGHLLFGENRERPRPAERAVRRQFDPKLTVMREEGIASTVDFVAPRGTSELLRVHASASHVWPPPVLTRVETVYAVVPENAVAVYVTIPAFGFVVEGEREHLASVVHENNGTIVYRAVAQPPFLAGGGGAVESRRDTALRVVSITTVYPCVSPEVSSEDLHPKTCVYVYGPSSTVPSRPRVEVLE